MKYLKDFVKLWGAPLAIYYGLHLGANWPEIHALFAAGLYLADRDIVRPIREVLDLLRAQNEAVDLTNKLIQKALKI